MENSRKKGIKLFTALFCAFAAAFLPLFSSFGDCAPVKAQAAAGKWVASWATSLVNGSIELGSVIPGVSVQDVIPSKSTIRTEVTVTAGGSMLRFKFSNQYGQSAITINEAGVAKTLGDGNADIVDGTQLPILFDGKSSVTIPAGETVWSDTVDMVTQPLEKLSVSLYFKNLTYITSTGLSNGRTFLASGLLSTSDNASKVNRPELSSISEINIGSGTITYHTIPFLSNIDTYTSTADSCAVFIGDSTLVNDTYLYFAKKLISSGYTDVSVVNEAVIGNKLLSDGSGLIGNLYGEAMIDRFSRDVLNISGVKYCFVKIGLNDIAHQYSKSLSSSTPKYTPSDLIDGYRTLIKLCHSRGIKIYFFTKSPWKGYERSFLGQSGDLTWSMDIQKLCDELNEWITTNTEADGYIDCSPLANPSDPYALCPSFTPDGAHLTDTGAVALADLIPVSFVGANESSCKTAASIAGVDPYKEKKQILAQMNAAAQESTTASNRQDGNQSGAVTEPSVSREVTAAPTEEPATEPATEPEYQTVIQNEEPVTVPEYTSAPQDTAGSDKNIGNAVDVKYNVMDIDSIGSSGSSVGFVLILFTAIVGSGTAVILVMNKRKEEL